MIIFTSDASRDQLQHATSGLVLRLYVNDAAPAKGKSFSPVEVSGAGYEPRLLIPKNCERVKDEWVVRWPAQEFRFTAKLGNVYGYYLTRDGLVVGGERFGDGPYEIFRDGDQITINPIEIKQPV